MSSKMMISLPLTLASKPIAVITLPEEVVPLYDANLIKQTSASIVICLNKSAVNKKEPFNMDKKMGR